MKSKMMPGQEPYTLEEQMALRILLDAATRAEELCRVDDLEAFADELARQLIAGMPTNGH